LGHQTKKKRRISSIEHIADIVASRFGFISNRIENIDTNLNTADLCVAACICQALVKSEML
jgi:hypothetical protein